ncbi:MAG: hypothetical protein GX798_00890 [Bacteroidales bacterium]|nr:hypothetical protein [Bacteroidales bacterium]
MQLLKVKKVVFESVKPSIAEVAAMFDRENIAFQAQQNYGETYDFSHDFKGIKKVLVALLLSHIFIIFAVY